LEKPLGFHKKGSLNGHLQWHENGISPELTVNSDAPKYGKGGLE